MIQAIVHAKYYGGTHCARCGVGADAQRGSSTSSNEWAARLAAQKWFRARRITGQVSLQAMPAPAKGWQASYIATIT